MFNGLQFWWDGIMDSELRSNIKQLEKEKKNAKHSFSDVGQKEVIEL